MFHYKYNKPISIYVNLIVLFLYLKINLENMKRNVLILVLIFLIYCAKIYNETSKDYGNIIIHENEFRLK